MSARRVLFLGPQRTRPTLGSVVDELGLRGPLATVTAGWEEREAEDTELHEHLGGRTRNLGLYPRAEEVFRAHPEVREVLFERFDRLRERAELYRLRLAAQLEVCRVLLARTDPAEPDGLLGPEIQDAIEGVRALDQHHLEAAARLDAEIHERLAGGAFPELARHRAELGQLLSEVEGLLVAGGHVGVLLNRLRLFGVLDLAPALPVVAWSGGAMVLCDRIVLFHDSPPQGPGDAEVYAPGLGLVRGIVPLPHANHRLRLDDPARVALFARRFAPALCPVLDGGERLECDGGAGAWTISDETRVLEPDGAVRPERVA